MSDSGHLWTHEKFLQSAQNKRSLNQSNGVPNMRIQALLEATCRRLRLERKNLKREFPDDEWPPIKTDGEVEEKKSRFDFVSSLCCPEGMYNNNNNKCELACLALMDSSLTPNKSNSLWDDPKQVEDFLRLVNHNNNNNNNITDNNNNNNNTINNNFTNNNNNNSNNVDKIYDNDNISDNNNNTVMENFNNKLDFGDVSSGSEEQTTNQMSSLVSNYDVNSFTVEFDNLYKELVQNLITVESLMSQSAFS